MTTSRTFGPIALAMAVVVVSCGPIRPQVDASRVIHIENRVKQAILVQIDVRSQGDGATYVTAVRPCEGTASLTFGEQIPVVPGMDGWQTILFVDPSGQFDTALAAWRGDPADMPGTFPNLTTVVSARGDIPLDSLPKWLTVTETGATMNNKPTPAGSVPDCMKLDPSILHPPS